MGNSTVRAQAIVDYARTYPDLSPVLATGGFSQEPALTILNDVMIAMLNLPNPWPWNRQKVPVFYSNSWQQDYALPGLTSIAWLENGIVVDINSTSEPKYKCPIEANRDLPETSLQYGHPGQVCCLPNSMLIYGTWGGGNTGEGLQSNPGPGSVYGPLLNTSGSTVISQPANPLLQVKDPNGNLWVLTNALINGAVLGMTQPAWPTNPVYPTFTNPTVVATTIADGTGIWTAVNPFGQGMRINPIPSQMGKVWQIRLFGQMRPPQFTNLSQFIDPIPDDWASYFRRGFIAYAYMHSKDLKVQRKFESQQSLWMAALTMASKSMDRERDNAGIYPTDAPMTQPSTGYIGPANPWWLG